MTEPEVAYGDPLSRPFWAAAQQHRLVLQKCNACGRHQFYARPFCIVCEKEALEWIEAAGTGTVYSAVTVHLPVVPDLEPPYVVAVVELDEGPRITANILEGRAPIGSRVRVDWRERAGLPPVPVFIPIQPVG